MSNAAAYPYPAIRATFSRKREKGFDRRRRMPAGAGEARVARPLSRLRERVRVRVTLGLC
jgi:hypothetical protein